MKKIFALLLAILVVSSFSITAFAAPVDEATIDTSRTGTLDIYKYDLTNAEKDGVWDSSYVSTGVKDANGVEAVLGDPNRVSPLNANGNAYGYAIKGVEFTYVTPGLCWARSATGASTPSARSRSAAVSCPSAATGPAPPLTRSCGCTRP